MAVAVKRARRSGTSVSATSAAMSCSPGLSPRRTTAAAWPCSSVRAEAGALLPDPIEVRVLDGTGRPSAGATIVFGFVDEVEGAAIDPASALTDEQGHAAAVVRLGESPGEQLIVAEVADTDVPDLRARFTATATAPDDDDDGKGKKGGRGKGGP